MLTFLYILLGIVAFIIALFCIPVIIVLDYDKEFLFEVRYLFIKYKIYPPREKPEEKEKKEEKDKKKKGEEKGEDKDKKAKDKKENPIKTFYKNQGFDALLDLIKYTAKAVGGALKNIFRAFVFRELYVKLSVSKGDAAQTAYEYGKLCAEVFPAMGLICSNVKVKKYALDVSPDFIGNNNKAFLHAKISVMPIKLTNAVIALAFKLLFKVLLKVLFSNIKSQSKKQKSEIKQTTERRN